MLSIAKGELRTTVPNTYKSFQRVGLTLPIRNLFTARATMDVLPPSVRPLQPPVGSKVNFGAQVNGVDLENLTGL